MNTHLFNLEEEETTDRWIEEMNTPHVPETEEYGVSNIIFESGEAPFHPERLNSSSRVSEKMPSPEWWRTRNQKFSVASIEQKAKCGLLMRIPTP